MGSIGVNKTTDYASRLSLNYPIGSNKMETITVDDKQILTNYGAWTYPTWDNRNGVRPKGYEVSKTKSWRSEVSTADIVNDFIKQGYDKIRVFRKKVGLNHFTDIMVAAGYRRK